MEQALRGDFVVFVAQSAEEAIEVLGREKLHAVVSDQNLGDGKLTGVEFLAKVAELQPHAARVLVTASKKMEDAEQAINKARVNHFLQKPFSPDVLRQTVGLAVHNAALVAIREKMIQELKQQIGLKPAGKAAAPKEGPQPAPKRGDARSPEPSKAGGEIDERLVFRDGLTGLYNHRYFQEALSAGLVIARRHEQKLALVLIDIDKFRQFNRKRSYAEGDKLLRQVAQMMMEEPSTSRSRGPAEIAARYGEDIFGVILSDANQEKGKSYAEKIREAAEELDFTEEGGSSSGEVTVTAAVAIFPDVGTTEEELIAAAEKALRTAKNSGGNRVVLAKKI
jgi:diguanylate cyclase (GGDEF)-like protein